MENSFSQSAGKGRVPENRRNQEGNERRGKGWSTRETWRARSGRSSKQRWEAKLCRGVEGRDCPYGELPSTPDCRVRRLPLPARRSRVAQKGRYERRQCQGRIRHGQRSFKWARLQVTFSRSVFNTMVASSTFSSDVPANQITVQRKRVG